MNNVNVYLRLLNARRFAAGMKSAGGSLAAFRTEVAAANTYGGKLAATGHLLEGSFMAASSAARYLASGIGLAAAATIGLGVQYNATIEANSLAFEHFAGSAKASKAMVQDLWTIASKTPFSFQDITTGARRLLAFGFNVQETTGLLKTMGDTLSYTGGSTDEVLRLAKALGDIRAKGRLMQQEMNQLANIGIPIREVLAKGGLELTQKQLMNIGKAGIPAEDAINAIKAGLDNMFGGGAERYLETFNGQWQRLKDNISRAAGSATGGTSGGIFQWLKDGMKFLNDSMPAIDKFLGSSGFQGAVKGTMQGIGGFFKFLVDRGKEFFNAIKPMEPFWKNVLWPMLQGLGGGIIGGVVVAWEMLIGVLTVTSKVLGWVGSKLGFLSGVFKLVGAVVGFVFGGEILRLLSWLPKLGWVFGLLAVPVKLMGVIFEGIGKAMFWVGGRIGMLVGLIPRIGGAFRSVASTLGGWWQGFKLLFAQAVIFVSRLGPRFEKAALAIGDYIFHGIKTGVQKLFGFLTGVGGFVSNLGGQLKDWINDHTLFGDNVKIGPLHTHIPALAMGGTFTGMALVGEAGPELAHHTPQGTVITPLRARPGGQRGSTASNLPEGRFTSGSFRLVAPINLGRRQVAEAVFEYKADRSSRD
jgi:hypothetical protein